MKYILIVVFSWWVPGGHMEKGYEVEMQEFNSLYACKDAKQYFKDMSPKQGNAVCVEKGYENGNEK